jgi:hypothetical protein
MRFGETNGKSLAQTESREALVSLARRGAGGSPDRPQGDPTAGSGGFTGTVSFAKENCGRLSENQALKAPYR